jgi:hypothetical protein
MTRLRRAGCAISLMLSAVLATGTGWAADPPDGTAGKKADTSADVPKLKAQLEAQEKQIEALRAALEAQKKVLDQVLAQQTAGARAPAAANSAPPASAAAQRKLPTLGEVASTSPILPPDPTPSPTPILNPPQPQPRNEAAPLQLHLGNISITPVGFLDAAGVWRSKAAGSGIGSNFGNIPFDNSVPGGKLSEFRFSPQNSRIGFRIDGNWKGYKFTNYLETDFLGTGAANNIGITNGAFVPRIRLFWLSVRKGGWEFLGGQSWSMFTPSRKGIAALPGNVFYSQVFDVNYLIGLPWTRQPGFRLLYHGPDEKVTFGISLENPNQYMGGYGGSAQIVLPASLSGIAGSQLDNGSAGFLSTPNVRPDLIAKLAFDPTPDLHLEVGGISRTFKVYNTSTGMPTSGQTFSSEGYGGEFNGEFAPVKHFRLISNNAVGAGIGRYFFGNAPDVIVRADGSLSPIHVFGSTDGFETTVNKTLFYFYFGGLFTHQNVAVDTNGNYIGWGYPGSSNGQDHSIEEYTFGINQTLWKSPAYGAVNFMAQYEYATRSPWYVAPGAMSNAADHTVYFDLRYSLPGAPPK